jgi:condensin complex subunit 3
LQLPAFFYDFSHTYLSIIKKVAMDAYKLISETYSSLDDDLEMIPPNQAALLLLDWTDPRNIM